MRTTALLRWPGTSLNKPLGQASRQETTDIVTRLPGRPVPVFWAEENPVTPVNVRVAWDEGMKIMNCPQTTRWSASLTTALVILLPACAANLSWNAAVSGDWNTAANWSPAQVPTSSDTVFIANNPHQAYDSFQYKPQYKPQYKC